MGKLGWGSRVTVVLLSMTAARGPFDRVRHHLSCRPGLQQVLNDVAGYLVRVRRRVMRSDSERQHPSMT